jgi:hypothetical protein
MFNLGDSVTFKTPMGGNKTMRKLGIGSHPEFRVMAKSGTTKEYILEFVETKKVGLDGWVREEHLMPFPVAAAA